MHLKEDGQVDEIEAFGHEGPEFKSSQGRSLPYTIIVPLTWLLLPKCILHLLRKKLREEKNSYLFIQRIAILRLSRNTMTQGLLSTRFYFVISIASPPGHMVDIVDVLCSNCTKMGNFPI